MAPIPQYVPIPPAPPLGTTTTDNTRLQDLLTQDEIRRIVGQVEENAWYQRFVSPSTSPSLIEVLQKMEGLYTEIQVLERRVCQLEASSAVGKRFLQKTKSE